MKQINHFWLKYYFKYIRQMEQKFYYNLMLRILYINYKLCEKYVLEEHDFRRFDKLFHRFF